MSITCQSSLISPGPVFLFTLQHSCHRVPWKHHLITFSNHLQNVKRPKLCSRHSIRTSTATTMTQLGLHWKVCFYYSFFFFCMHKTVFCNGRKCNMIFKIHMELCWPRNKSRILLRENLVLFLFLFMIMLYSRCLVVEMKVIKKMLKRKLLDTWEKGENKESDTGNTFCGFQNKDGPQPVRMWGAIRVTHISHGVLNIYPSNLDNWQLGRQIACFHIIFLFESKVLNLVSPLI